MDIPSSVTQYFYQRAFPAKTERWYQQKLNAFTIWLDAQGVSQLDELTHHHVLTYLHTLSEQESVQFKRPLSTKTLHGYARAIKAFVRWAEEEEYLTHRVAGRIRMPKVDETLVETLSKEDITRLLAACGREKTWLADRDRTIISILLDTGIRASELTGLTLPHVYLGLTESYLLVLGKGGKEREVPVGKGARARLHRYLHHSRPTRINDLRTPWVFPSRRFTRLTVQGLDKTLYRLRDLAGVDATVRAHVFRHTMAVMFIEQGGDVLRLSRILGHSSLAVTQEYLKQFSSRQARQGAVSVFDGL